ncbi:hypothetical protein FA95DRAFT_1578375 [Auriscalpium vulgare]|uniref:Uncharacterized protein n=1 Tax=Auriscalpium vulgare TaxID=40419 RepID=A0ACB8R2C0_9AGAM|nr:hypothetical protein FA95DRAFT_1578375 [Auriscalpium vulgare]
MSGPATAPTTAIMCHPQTRYRAEIVRSVLTIYLSAPAHPANAARQQDAFCSYAGHVFGTSLAAQEPSLAHIVRVGGVRRSATTIRAIPGTVLNRGHKSRTYHVPSRRYDSLAVQAGRQLIHSGMDIAKYLKRRL